MREVVTPLDRSKLARILVLELYFDKDNVAGMRGNANAIARFLREIRFTKKKIETVERYVDRVLERHREKLARRRKPRG
jgi:aminoglycoside phosphotransferase family enzyme